MKTKTRIKRMIPDIIAIAIYVLAYIVFVISLITNLVVLAYVTGIILMFGLLYFCFSPLFKKSSINFLDWLFATISYISFAVIAGVYIAVIPDSTTREVFLAITASSLGGLLTLFGVGITIKYTRLDKKEDELKSAKPTVFSISPATWSTIPKDQKRVVSIDVAEKWSDLKKPTKGQKRYRFKPIFIANADVSLCMVYGLMVNEKMIKFDYELVLLKNSFNCLVIDYDFYISEKIETVEIVLEDFLHNTYTCEARIDLPKNNLGNSVEIELTSLHDSILAITQRDER